MEYEATVDCSEKPSVFLLSDEGIIFGRMDSFGMKLGAIYANVICDNKQTVNIPLKNFGKTAFIHCS